MRGFIRRILLAKNEGLVVLFGLTIFTRIFVLVFFWFHLDSFPHLSAEHALDQAPPVQANEVSSMWYDFWRSLKSSQIRTHVLSRRHNPVEQEDITMLTHTSVGKLHRLLIQIQLWGGPVSAAIYLASFEETRRFIEFTATNSEILQNTAFHVLLEKNLTGYPYNKLRNLAMDQAESDYFLAMDVDFVTPLEGCYGKIRQMLRQPNSRARKLLQSKTLLVLPAFERLAPSELDEHDTRTEASVEMLPRSKVEVLEMVQNRTVLPFYMEKWELGHAPTNFSKWYEGSSEPLYLIEYGFKFEPYVLGFRHGVPGYWPFFRGGRMADKYSWFLEAHYMGFRFAVLQDHFVVHMNHPYPNLTDTEAPETLWLYFKKYLMDVYGVPRAELEDWYGFLDEEGATEKRLD